MINARVCITLNVSGAQPTQVSILETDLLSSVVPSRPHLSDNKKYLIILNNERVVLPSLSFKFYDIRDGDNVRVVFRDLRKAQQQQIVSERCIKPSFMKGGNFLSGLKGLGRASLTNSNKTKFIDEIGYQFGREREITDIRKKGQRQVLAMEKAVIMDNYLNKIEGSLRPYRKWVHNWESGF